LGVWSDWYGKATATSTVKGQNSVSCTFKGSLVLTIFLSQVASPKGAGGPVVPQNSVAGRMTGDFDARVSTATRRVTGAGTAEWTIGGTYDPAEETLAIAIRSSGVDAKGTEATLERTGLDEVPVEHPISTSLNWGWQVPTNVLGLPIKASDPSTILDLMKPPAPPVIPSGREADLCIVESLPQTGPKEFRHLLVNLRDPRPQTVTQTFQDETGLGIRTTTWEFTLVPNFDIERDDRALDGRYSFVSTDFIRLRMVIPGVTVAKSGWADLVSWGVKGLGPFSGSGIPNRLPRSTAFGFRPNPGTRPTDGSTSRNRPIQYTVSATLVDTVHYFILTQDDTDLLRQEYIDHNEGIVPSRADCIARPVDDSFNTGNYNLVIDGGMQAAFDKVAVEFRKASRDNVRVLSGFRSPQRNKATGDIHPKNKHVLGRALDLAPDPGGADALMALYQACLSAGYHSFCESAPGNQVPLGSPNAKHVHIDW
jgi:hypothetical protein